MEIKYKVPKRADGTFTCNVIPSHALDPKPYIQLGTSDSITIEDATIYSNGGFTKFRCKYYITNTTGGYHIGYNSNTWRLFHYQASYAFFDCGGESGSYRHQVNDLKKNTIYDLTITNSSIYNNDTQSYIGQWTQAPISSANYDKSIMIGSGIRVFEVDCYDGANNLICSLRPKQYDATQWGLYDSVNDKWYAVGKTKGETEFAFNAWNGCKSIDFGGANVTFSGTFSGNSTSITSLTNGTLLSKVVFRGCSKLKEFSLDYSNITNGQQVFSGCSSLLNFDSKLTNLVNGEDMFAYTNLASFDIDMPRISSGHYMFNRCYSLEDFSVNLSTLANGYYMFGNCKNLRSFKSNITNLTKTTNMFAGCTSLTDFYVAALPKDYNVVLDLTSCPISELSWLYMATNCPVVEDLARGGCTLKANIQNSGDTTLQAVLNYFVDKGYFISGYTRQIPNTYYCTEIRDDATEAWLWNPQGRGFDNEDVVAITNSCINNYFTVNLPYRGGEYWVRIRCYTDQPVTCILEGVEYHLGFMEETDVIHVVK